MAMRRGPRLQVGSAAWIAEERESALNIAHSEIDEFSFSARNEIDWLNEHMAEIFSENQVNVAELFKTPGKLRGKTPRTIRQAEPGSARMPLSNVFSTTPQGAPNPFSISSLTQLRSPKIRVAEDKPDSPVARLESPSKAAVVHPPRPVESRAPISLADSGYHGSQSQDTAAFDHFDKDIEMSDSPARGPEEADLVFSPPSAPAVQSSPSVASIAETLQSPKEDQTKHAMAYNGAATPSSAILQPSSPFASRTRLPIMSPRSPSPNKMSSPVRHSPQKATSSPQRSIATSPQRGFPKPTESFHDAGDRYANDGDDGAEADDVGSPSEASSPIRPVVRKSSLNFASLPAREPLTSKKSIGGSRMSRTSHLDFSRPSYYNRQTGGKSLGNAFRPETEDDDDEDEIDVDDEIAAGKEDADSGLSAHSKTYTQRLQDQISMLGKAQSSGPRPSKSIANLLPSQQTAPASRSQSETEPALGAEKPPSPKPKESATPGAFPDDDEDDWIAPPEDAAVPASPKPTPQKNTAAEVTGSPAGQGIVSRSEAMLPRSRQASPEKTPFSPNRPANHGKSASVPTLPTIAQLNAEDAALKKTISVSNPTLASVAEDDLGSTPPKSPRSFRENPLNKVKNKLSMLLKSSKGLIASSAAVSAEGKSSLLQSPSTARLGYHATQSVDSFRTADTVMYPDLSQQIAAVTAAPLSPTRTNSTRRTRASTERERIEIKEREKEIKEAKRLAEQMDKLENKLEKEREKEREKARVFSKEQDKIAAMEKQVAAQKEQEKASQVQAPPPAQDFRTPGPPQKSAHRSPVKTARTMTKEQAEEGEKNTAAHSDDVDLDMTDAPTTIPQSIPRPTTASSMRAHGTKRPIKPTKDTVAKSKQAPTVIRVNTTSSQHTQFHPSNSVLSNNLHETLGQQPAPSRQLKGKASQASLHGKTPTPNLTSSISSSGRPKALELAAKRREQEERDAQQKRETKLEAQRKRTALEEERRQERQREEERKAAQAKKAAIEKAKQTKAPPPAVRSQPNGPPEYSTADRAPARPPSRLGSTMHQDGRLVNTVLSSNAKGPSKRPLQQDANEESSRSQPQRVLASYKEPKRMRMSEEFDEDIDMMDSHNQRIKGPPVRPSAGFKRDLPTKSMYGNGYANAPPASASREFYKATVTAQHHAQAKAAHPMDMAQVSKSAIPFAQNGNPAYKTPARPAGGSMLKSAKSAKTANRSSPRFQNGETIELPDIETDEDSDDSDGGGDSGLRPDWAASPALNAALIRQEGIDPMQVFGPPAPLVMEEVFNKTKDRWQKFRARTSSANWSGTDRLTEEEVRRDNAARDKMIREGGWSYELGREM